MAEVPKAASFDQRFARWASRVRARQLLRATLSGAAIGLALGALTATGLWKLRKGPWRPVAGVLGLVGAGAGALVARRKRFDDEAVALYLDGRLGSQEVVTTAVMLGARAGEDDSSRAVVLGQASALLEQADPLRVRPPVLVPFHALLPVAAAGLVLMSVRALPPAPVNTAPPGMEKVTLADVRGLEKVAELGAMNARDDEQKKRLEKLADDARKLQNKLRDGVERREAQSEIAKLQDAIAAEKLSLGEGERRRGLEAALARLAQDPLTKDAAKALGDRDLVKFDEEMQKLANSREKADRERAKKALEEAAEAAKKAGAPDVAKALEDQKKLLEDRGKRADELRELGEALKGALSDEELRELQEFGNDKSDKSAKSAAKALGEALKKLTPEERKRLAEKLKKKIAEQGATPGGPSDSLKDLAKELETEEGKKRLEEELRKLANEDDDDAEAERQRKLAEAEKGLGSPGAPPPPPPGGKGDKGEKGQGQPGQGLNGLPLPMPGAGSPGKPGEKGGGDKAGDGSPNSGHSEDTGTGDHKGHSKEINGGDLRARAQAKMNGAAPNAGVTIGRSAGREGDTANLQGNGGIGKAAPGEVSGVEKSDVPEEYREHVGRYFQPLEAVLGVAYAHMTQGPGGVSFEDRLSQAASAAERLRKSIGTIVVGQSMAVDQVLWGMMAGGHVLLEGAPGLGKTLLVKTLSQCLALSFSRIQFTPDLMPSDVLGTNVLVSGDAGQKMFRLHRGPIFGQVVLADEINRATPKTQSALLEAMQEHSVTIAGERHALKEPFFVLATENPIEMEGTYPLPEAQLDRFLVKVIVPSPTEDELVQVLGRTTGQAMGAAEQVLGEADVLALLGVCRDIAIAEPILRYATRLVRASDPQSPQAPDKVKRGLRFGAGVRGAQSLVLAAKAVAMLEGRANVGFSDVQRVAAPCLRHRLIRSFEGEADGITTDDVVTALLADVPTRSPEVERAVRAG